MEGSPGRDQNDKRKSNKLFKKSHFHEPSTQQKEVTTIVSKNGSEMKFIMNIKPQRGRWDNPFRCVRRRYRVRTFLQLIIIVCFIGIYFNHRLSLDSTLNTFPSRRVSEGVHRGLPEEMTRKMILVDVTGNTNATIEQEARNAFSACLIVKDDNHWLIEWLAYHYHVLPLRHLILVKDPTSITSPNNILDRWSDKMIIEQWTDDDFLPEWVHRKVEKLNLTDVWLHLNRQNFFYGKCLQSLKQQNRSFVALIDSDEFIRINPYRHRVSASFTKSSGHVHHFLSRLHKQSGNQSCWHVPRIQVSTLEKHVSRSLLGSRKPVVPEPFNASDFLTLRFLWHNEVEMEAGKNVVDLRNIQLEELQKRTESVHHAIPSCPNNTSNMLREKNSHLSIHHYLGTWEQFTFREDPR